MLGTWRWNVGLGIAGPVMTILFSIGHNPLPVIMMRSAYAFAAFFFLGYALRLALHHIAKSGVPKAEEPSGEETGKRLDLRMPDETEQLNGLLKSQLVANEGVSRTGDNDGQDAFRPLTPPKLVSAQNGDPEQLAKAIRHLRGG